jgi:glycosyltransferase involved in cell wall biosynthesis
MDIFVQPSLRDGQPNALLEAMVCEKAVVGTRVGGITDAVVDCENRRLVSTNDADELANVIIELLTNEPLRRKLGRAARQTIMHRFTPQAELDENLAVYHGLGLKV